jgi:hypothetical protein
MDDMEASLHPVNNYIRSRLSHTATPENSLPKELTILEEDLNYAYLMMKHVEQPQSTQEYFCMTPRGPLYSSPSAPSGSIHFYNDWEMGANELYPILQSEADIRTGLRPCRHRV